MNGAESLVKTLLAAGVDTCFANPGTSEMHFVHAVGSEPAMRTILCLFEGVCTGAADGYARMTGKPACTLLHLGPGLANATANIHNARRANMPMINLIGDHATHHLQYDAPLASDINGLASGFGDWLKFGTTAESIGQDAAEAAQASLDKGGQIANLVLPADCAWNPANSAAQPLPLNAPPKVDAQRVANAARILREQDDVLIVIGGHANEVEALEALDRISQACNATVLFETFNWKIPRGAGRVKFDKVIYFVEQAQEQLKTFKHVVTIGAKSPVAFFAYPNLPSTPLPEDCITHCLAKPGENIQAAIADLVDALSEKLPEKLAVKNYSPRLVQENRPQLHRGELSPASIAAAVGALMPEQAIVVDEAATASAELYQATEAAPAHDWLNVTGGSIGWGLPVATGAAVACPDRKVICLHGDGGAMYTIQSLWTQARENLDVLTIIFANRKYQILQIELGRVGASNPNQKTLDMLDISKPELNFVQIAQGMGVKATRVTTADEFNQQLESALQERGPRLIEAVY